MKGRHPPTDQGNRSSLGACAQPAVEHALAQCWPADPCPEESQECPRKNPIERHGRQVVATDAGEDGRTDRSLSGWLHPWTPANGAGRKSGSQCTLTSVCELQRRLLACKRVHKECASSGLTWNTAPAAPSYTPGSERARPAWWAQARPTPVRLSWPVPGRRQRAGPGDCLVAWPGPARPGRKRCLPADAFTFAAAAASVCCCVGAPLASLRKGATHEPPRKPRATTKPATTPWTNND